MPISLLHVTESLAPEAGSVALCLRGLFHSLKKHGIASAVLAQENVGVRSDQQETQPPYKEKLSRMVEQADLVHVHGWGFPLADTICRLAKAASKPYLISACGSLGAAVRHESSWGKRVRNWWVNRSLVKQAAAVCAVNKAEERELAAARIHRVLVRLPYGIDVSDYEEAPPPEGLRPGVPQGPYVLLLGPIHPAAGLVPLLKAFAELGGVADGWSLVAAGPEVGCWRTMLDAAVRRKGGEDRVVLTTAPDVAVQRAWLSRASILAAPSLRVGCGVAIMQAVATGIPVLASGAAVPDGLADVVHVCRPTRYEIHRALRSLLDMSDEQRGSLTRRAREAARTCVDWSMIIDDYLRFYRDLTSPHHP